MSVKRISTDQIVCNKAATTEIHNVLVFMLVLKYGDEDHDGEMQLLVWDEYGIYQPRFRSNATPPRRLSSHLERKFRLCITHPISITTQFPQPSKMPQLFQAKVKSGISFPITSLTTSSLGRHACSPRKTTAGRQTT